MVSRCLLIGLLLTLPWLASAQNRVQVHTVQHQPAEDLLPALQSVLRPGENIQAYHNDLIVNAAPDSQQAVAGLLQELDKPLRNLLINVRNNRTGKSLTQGTNISGGIRTGDVYLGTGRPVQRGQRDDQGGLVIRHDGLQVQTERTVRQSHQGLQQGLRVIEGYPAWISTGESRAYRGRDAYGYPTTGFRDADQGFYVTARLAGDRVQLQISTSNDHYSDDLRKSRHGVINTERVDTAVSGAIGEWINLGSLGTQDHEQDNGYTGKTMQTSSSWRDIAVQVIPAD